jgi:hypothetical protein
MPVLNSCHKAIIIIKKLMNSEILKHLKLSWQLRVIKSSQITNFVSSEQKTLNGGNLNNF